MLLWTIQTESAWHTLNARGNLRCRRRDADRDFLPAYEWMTAEMTARIGRPAKGISLPIWAWYQYDTAARRCPDLRRAAHLPRGTRGYRIEFEIADDQALLSDFELWHYVLNYCYLPLSEADADAFSSRNDSLRCSWSQPSQDKRIDSTIRSSWQRIFDLDWSDKYVTAPRAKKSIQATLWQLDLGQVAKVDGFVAR